MFHQFLTLSDSIVDGTNKVECCFRILIHFTVHDHVETADGFFDRHQYTFQTGELLGNVERLRQEALYFTCARYCLFIFFAQLVARSMFKQGLASREGLGIALVVVGVIILLNV